MGRFLAVLIAVVLLLLVSVGELWAFRCGNDLIRVGDRKYEVLRSCGEPVAVDSWEEVRRTYMYFAGHYYPSLETVTVEEWTYNLGPRMFLRFLKFANGRLEKIETGGYGY